MMDLVVKSLKGSKKVSEIDEQRSVGDLLQLLKEQHLCGLDPSSAAPHYLVHKEQVLGDCTLSSAGLVNGDTVVLLKHVQVQQPESLQDGPAPDAAMIKDAIKQEAECRGLDPSALEDEPAPRASRRSLLGLPRDLQDTDARLLQLISALGGHLHVMRDMPAEEERAEPEPASPPAEVRAPDPPPEALQQLMDMGFTEPVVRKALLLNRNQLQYALEWLLQHAEDPDAAEPVSQEQIHRIYGAPPRSRSVAATRSSIDRQHMIQHLVEMGFRAEDAGQAMDSFHTMDVALQWLLSRQAEHRNPGQRSAPPPTPSSEPSTPSAASAAANTQQQQEAATTQEPTGFQDASRPSTPASSTVHAAGDTSAAVGSSARIAGQDQPHAPSRFRRPQGAAGDADTHMQEAEHEGGEEAAAQHHDDEEEEEDEDEEEDEEHDEEEEDEEMGADVFLPSFMAVSPADMEQLMQGMSEMYGEAPFLTGDMEGTEMLLQMGPVDAAQLMSEMLQASAAAQAAGRGEEEEEEEEAEMRHQHPEPPV